MAYRRRNRPDKDGKDRTLFDNYRNRIKRECGEDGYVNCSICGLPINVHLPYPQPWSLTIDHIIPIAKGGETKETNLQPAHFRCNRKKGEKMSITLEDVNALRAEQGAPPLKTIIKYGYISSLTPEEMRGEAANVDADRARRGFPQSVNWRVF